MPPGDNVQVATGWLCEPRTFPNAHKGIKITLGGRGQAVKIWQVMHSLHAVATTPRATWYWTSSLSTNPNHEGDHVIAIEEHVRDESLYGRSVFESQSLGMGVGDTGVDNTRVWTQIIPLYGVIRPRNVIWVTYVVNLGIANRYSIEIVYEPIEMSESEMNALNLKYGKFRRS